MFPVKMSSALPSRKSGILYAEAEVSPCLFSVVFHFEDALNYCTVRDLKTYILLFAGTVT